MVGDAPGDRKAAEANGVLFLSDRSRAARTSRGSGSTTRPCPGSSRAPTRARTWPTQDRPSSRPSCPRFRRGKEREGRHNDASDVPEVRHTVTFPQRRGRVGTGVSPDSRERLRTRDDRPTADIGLIGLAVMGENLVLNMESHGIHRRRLQPDHVQGRQLHQRPRQGQEARRLPHAWRSWSPRSSGRARS